jgi:hypothetical protein
VTGATCSCQAGAAAKKECLTLSSVHTCVPRRPPQPPSSPIVCRATL